jgi:hypothetical protein
MTRYARAGGQDLFYLEFTRAEKGAPSFYFSAGIHGDEAGATEGLLAWAEKNVRRLRLMNCLIFPCLNPWGLINNNRFDADGRDLNRSFHDDSIPQIAAQLRVMKGRRFDLAVNLHEDYDARGVYVYEVPGPKPYWGEELLKAAGKFIDADSRRKIEGRTARAGVVRRAIRADLLPTWPEAFVLHFHYAARTFTIETPSEYLLDDRASAHLAMLSRAVSLGRTQSRSAAT